MEGEAVDDDHLQSIKPRVQKLLVQHLIRMCYIAELVIKELLR